MSPLVSPLSAPVTAAVLAPVLYTSALLVSRITEGEIKPEEVQEEWILWATEEVERQAGMKFRSTPFTDVLDGNYLTSIFTRCFPVIQVDSVTIDGQIIDPIQYCVNSRTGRITLLNGIFPRGFCNVVIKGKFGKIPLPPLIEKIATLIVAKTALSARCGSLVDSESIGGFNQSRSLKKINDQLDRAWAAWGRRFEIGFV